MSSFLLPRASVAGDCTKGTCPAEMSIYGYAPNWEFNLFFVVFFAVSAVVFYHQTLFYPKWRAFGASCAMGCAMESGGKSLPSSSNSITPRLTQTAGYVGRLLLSKDPFSDLGFKLNVVLLTIAPAFLSAAIYLTLKQATLVFGTHLSRIWPSWYIYIFVACDSVSMLLQGAGGAISSMAEDKQLLDDGVDIMIAGLVFQVFSLLVFLILVLDYVNRCRLNAGQLSRESKRLYRSTKFQLFVTGISVAFLCIFIRCCYRVAELYHGWGSEIMRKEVDFIILDSDMIVLAAIALNIFYPGVFFCPQEAVCEKGKRMDFVSRCGVCGAHVLSEV